VPKIMSRSISSDVSLRRPQCIVAWVRSPASAIVAVRRDYVRFLRDFFNRTPGPPPFSSMNSTPAATKHAADIATW
jgi:hypothetical protein